MLFDHVWRVFAAAALAAPVWARMEHRIARSNNHRTSTTAFNNTLPWGDDPKELVKRDGTKYVFMHHVRGPDIFSRRQTLTTF
jgi:glucan endo-1,3-alpha-glucosidase